MKPLLVVLVPLVALGLMIAVLRLPAQPTTPVAINQQLSTFGMVGLASGETARLNAFALPVGGPVVAGGCQVTFTFYDAQGNSLSTKTLPVNPGQAVHFDMPGTSTTVPPAEIRGAIRTSFNSPSATTRPVGLLCSIIPTMEIFNSAGQINVVLELSHALPTMLPL